MKARLCLSKPRRLPASLSLRSLAVVVSVSDLRRFSDTRAARAPNTNGMRQPQARNSSRLKSCCKTTSTSSASNWPPIRVTYWNEAKKPRNEQQERREGADGFIRGQHGDHQGTAAHHQHGNHHRLAAAVFVGNAAEQPAAHRTHEEAGGKDAGRLQQLGGRVTGREKGVREVQRAERVNVEVEPFDQVTGGSANDGLDALLGSQLRNVMRSIVGCHISLLVRVKKPAPARLPWLVLHHTPWIEVKKPPGIRVNT